MKGKKILVAGWHNGGVGPIAPVAKAANLMGASVTYLAYNSPSYSGEDAFRRRGIQPDEITDDATIKNCGTLIERFEPQVVLTGTSAPLKDSPNALEQNMVAAARSLGLRSVAVLDFWANYLERFSQVEIDTVAGGFRVIRPFAFLPDAICVMDEIAKAKMVGLGFPEDLLYVTGNPEFNVTFADAMDVAPATRETYLQGLGFNTACKTILVLTDHMESTYGDSFGYTEKTFLRGALNALDRIATGLGQTFNVIVRCHPGGGTKHFEETDGIILPMSFESLKVLRDQEKTEKTWLSSPDLVVGMTSTVLMKARFYSKPAISLQPGLKKPDLLITNAVGITTLCTSFSDFERNASLAIQGSLTQNPMPYVADSVERILRLL